MFCFALSLRLSRVFLSAPDCLVEFVAGLPAFLEFSACSVELASYLGERSQEFAFVGFDPLALVRERFEIGHSWIPFGSGRV